MSIHGECAKKIVRQMKVDLELFDPGQWWYEEMELLTDSITTIEKKSPRSAFLGLGLAGLIKGVTKDRFNPADMDKDGGYAVAAHAELKKLRMKPNNKVNIAQLWNKLVQGTRTHNQQLNIVIELWNADLLV